MYPKWLNNLFIFFDLYGFSTEFRESPKQRKFNLVIFVSHLIFGFVATSGIILYLLRPVDDQLGTINDISKFSALFLVYWLSLFEFYSQRSNQKKFWRYVSKIDRSFCCHQQFKLPGYQLRIKVYFTLSTLAYFLYLGRLLANTGFSFLYFWLSYVFMCTVFQVRSFYYLFFLSFIKHELKTIDREVTAMLRDCKTVKLQKIHKKDIFMIEFRRKRLKWIREYYEIIYQMCRVVNNVFGWSNVLAVLCHFHMILTDINWFYWKLLNKYQFNIHGNGILKLKHKSEK